MGYFKPLRQKIGVLTLGLACALATVFLKDARRGYLGRQLVFRTSQARHVVTSDENGISWWVERSPERSKTIHWIKFGEEDDVRWDPLYGFRPPIPYTVVSWKQQMKDSNWKTKWALMGLEWLERKRPGFKEIPEQTEVMWIVPHTTVVWSLSLLSAYLLLSKPKQRKPSIEPQANA